jgi:hypothetical protein
MLVMLSALSVSRPIGWTIASYLQARQRPRSILALEALKLVVMLVAIVTFGTRSPLWTCAAVGTAFAAHALASLWLVQRLDGLPLGSVLGNLGRVLLACAPMVVAVLGVRLALGTVGIAHPALGLFLETLAGVVAYPPAALLMVRGPSRDLLVRALDAVRPTK